MSERLLPPDREVDCPCDTAFHRAVFLDSTGRNERVVACLRCGEVSFIECQVDEPHPHHVVCIANRVMPLSDAATSWLSQWPRRVYLTYNDPPALLPASYRARSVEELKERIASAVHEQREWTNSEKALRAGIPVSPPPDLPEALHAYRESWQALQWNDTTSTRDLVMAVHGTPGSAEIAGDLLRRRADAVLVILEMLASPIPSVRTSALYCIYSTQIRSPEIADALVHLLKTLPRNETALEPVFCALLGMGALAAPARPLLRDYARRAAMDYFFQKRLQHVEELIADAERRKSAT